MDFNKNNNKKSNALTGEVRLNRYIAHCGVCSRREADELILQGLVKVNGKTVDTLGQKVIVGKDEVSLNGKKIVPQNFVYILVNKPKNCICTTEDEKGRRTLLDLIEGATTERVYPVGRLDRNTTGLILLTNDGEVAKKLSHPSSQIPKLYYAKLNKPITNEIIEQLIEGITLEDGFIAADRAGLVEDTTDEVGIEIHSGKNHIVKRMFEHIGYQVIALDRVQYGFLTKKGLKKGTYRFLTEKEVHFLKMNYLSKTNPLPPPSEIPKNYKKKSNLPPTNNFEDQFKEYEFSEEDLKNLHKHILNPKKLTPIEEINFDDL